MTVLVSYALIFTGGDKSAVFALEFTSHCTQSDFEVARLWNLVCQIREITTTADF